MSSSRKKIALPLVPDTFVEGTIGRLRTVEDRRDNGGFALVKSVSRTMVCFEVPNMRAKDRDDVFRQIFITIGEGSKSSLGFRFTSRQGPRPAMRLSPIERLTVMLFEQELGKANWGDLDPYYEKYLGRLFEHVNEHGSPELVAYLLDLAYMSRVAQPLRLRSPDACRRELGRVLSGFMHFLFTTPSQFRRILREAAGGRQALHDLWMMNETRVTLKDACWVMWKLVPEFDDAAKLFDLDREDDLAPIGWHEALVVMLVLRRGELDDLKVASIPTIIAKRIPAERWKRAPYAKKVARAFGYRKPAAFWKREVAPLVPTDA